MEILAPAGSEESLKAAVYGGADAVYIGSEVFNARVNASNFTENQIKECIKFCHARGVKVYATMNTLISGREMVKALQVSEMFVNAGIDAFIVQDLGFSQELRKCTDVPLHASTQMTVNNLDGTVLLQNMGFERVVLARELSSLNIKYITKRSPIETEVFVHGAMCMSYSGQCYMSSVIGGRSGNRGCCAQPCRLPYRGGYRLSLKDMCLLKYVKQLQDFGVSSIKIEGRMKTPEYVYNVTKAYADAVRGTQFTQKTEDELSEIFSRGGFTSGYYDYTLGKNMFGVHEKSELKIPVIKSEYKRIGLKYILKSFSSDSIKITGITDDGLSVEKIMSYQKADNQPTDIDSISKNLSRLGNTAYYFAGIQCSIESNIFLPASILNDTRRQIVADLTNMRLINNNFFNFRAPDKIKRNLSEQKKYIEAWFYDIKNVPLEGIKADFLWLNITSVENKNFDLILDYYGDNVGLYLPRIVDDDEMLQIKKLLLIAKDKKIKRILCGNLGLIKILQSMNFNVYGDFGLNVFNEYSKEYLKSSGLSGCTLSFEMNQAQVEDICDDFCTVIEYGRLPFMYTRNCIKSIHRKNEFLIDRKQKSFLVTCEYGCRNQIWNSDILYMADKYIKNVSRIRLIFTDEEVNVCSKIISEYKKYTNFVPDYDITRGLFYKKI